MRRESGPWGQERSDSGEGKSVTPSEIINPATEEVLRTVEQTDEAGVDDAVARAK
jgi:acyl-CoA reductase-like NAD-dependent aldehyde dehydrogenase